MRLLGNRVMVKADQEMERVGSIILAPTSRPKPTSGKVIQKGDQQLFALCGEHHMPIHIEVGDRILYASFAGDSVEVNGEELKVIEATAVIAVLDEKVGDVHVKQRF